MLGRAKKEYRANAPAPKPAKPPGEKALSKLLFPSSSPQAQDGDITQWASRPERQSGLVGLGSGSPGRRRANMSSNPTLNSRITDSRDPAILRPTNHAHPLKPLPGATSAATAKVKPSPGFASLCNKKNPFEDGAVPSGLQTKTLAPVVDLYEDDFSDDDDLELDYRRPDFLPTQASATQPVRPASRHLEPAPPTAGAPSSQPIPWSSSPPEHCFPALAAPRPSVAKRKLPNKWTEQQRGVHGLSSSQAKKRPPYGGWEPSYRGVNESEEPSMNLQKPRSNTQKRATPWDTTEDAIKEKRSQYKIQNKKSASEAGPSEEITRAADDSQSTKSTKPGAAFSLSSEQQDVIDLVIEKKQSIFFTGPAGTGKSILMRAIIAGMKRKHARDPERLSVTASTGLAACNIGGMTLHSFAGIGLGKEDVHTLVKKIRANSKAKTRWLRTSTLVIDEISMVDGELFDKLEQIARLIRNNGRPWGGIQLVITGDFFQLPPVPDWSEKKKEAKFAFEALTWNISIDRTIGLTQVFRQKDPHFANMLNEIRLGRISPDTIQTFGSMSRPLQFEDGLDVTELFPTRAEVERSNNMRLRNLPGEPHRFDAADSGHPDIKEKLLSNMMAPKTIELKKGAQVMLIKNLDETLVNGSLGKIKGFMSQRAFDLWTGNSADSDVGEDTAEGDANKGVKPPGRILDTKLDTKEFPLVQFSGTDGSHRTLLILPEDWKVELPNGETQAQRKQLPLILAWALSIHKAQGQTLERVKVDLRKIFEKGQAYVALSRATCREGLQVMGFEKSKVMAHAKVIRFYNELYSTKELTTMHDTACNASRKIPSGLAPPKMSAGTAKPSTGPSRKPAEVFTIDSDEEEAMMQCA